MKTNRKSRRSAFTLLEVLLVVGILALLAAFVVPNLIGISDQAKEGLAKSAVGRNGPIAGAIKRYRSDLGVYPDDDEGLAALFERPRSIDDDDERWKGPYLEGTPEELRDPWDREYQYKSPGDFNESSFDLWSMGRDEREDDDDLRRAS